MSRVHVQQIRSFLEKEFRPLIDLSDVAERSERERGDHLLTRSLAAYALMLHAHVSPEVAASHVVDGFDDNGIDAVFFDSAEHRLYVVQAKWIHDGNGSPALGDVLKFVAGVNAILAADFAQFGSRFTKVHEEIRTALYDEHTRFSLIIAYTGRQRLSTPARRQLDRFLAEVNDTSELAVAVPCAQGELHEAISGRADGAPINLPDVVLFEWGQVHEPHLAYYGQCAASDVASWYASHKDRLFAKNIRKVISDSEINQAITASLLTDPDRFWYLNNGITVICNKVLKKPIGGRDRGSGSFACSGVSVVNGAQTVGALTTAQALDPEKLSRAKVMVRFISTENCPPEFGRDVTRAANTQNRIVSKDFAALDPHQQRLWRELAIDGKEYAFRTGEPRPPPERGCTIDDATVALACAHGDVSLAVIAKSAVGRLWSDIERQPYTTLFNQKLTGERLWRTVEVLRAVDRALTPLTRDEVRKKDALVAVHGNRFVAHQVFKRLPRGSLNDGVTDTEQLLADARALVPSVVTDTSRALDALYPRSYLQSLFKNAAKCEELDKALGNGSANAASLPLPFPSPPRRSRVLHGP